MAAFDVPALTRGISGLFTAKEEGKRFAEDRAREQQSQAVADLLSRSRAQELQDRGRRARESRDAAKARAAADKEATEQGQRQRADFILSNLGADDLERIKGFESQTLPDRLKTLETALRRQRTKADRVPRVGPKPPRDPEEVKAEERRDAILKKAAELGRGEMSGLPANEIMSAATLFVDQQQSFLENEPKFKGALGHVLQGVGSALNERISGQEPTSSDEDLVQARQMVQGLDPATARQELQTAGFSADEITRILGG
ncbi:hypothetical protein LCGC14_2424590 [marine sediment metagenome]|uniref:Uncharacterized protein n=1 Tax=marine sediment metagenome TaxID=412755 RepID=A0A0F9E0S6_9ZZZZ